MGNHSGNPERLRNCARTTCDTSADIEQLLRKNRYNFSLDKAAEVYDLAKSVVVLVPKDDVTKMLVQEAATQLTSISHSVETYRTEMNRLASMLPEYPVVMAQYGVGTSFGPPTHGGDWRHPQICQKTGPCRFCRGRSFTQRLRRQSLAQQ